MKLTIRYQREVMDYFLFLDGLRVSAGSPEVRQDEHTWLARSYILTVLDQNGNSASRALEYLKEHPEQLRRLGVEIAD